MATVRVRYAPNIRNYRYLIHPLKESAPITEGFLYTKEERDILNRYFHKGIDYASTHKTPVYASASGYAVAGYHRYTVLNEDNTPKLYDGKPFSSGLGYFVQIYHPYKISRVKGGRITIYGHLSKFGDGIYSKTHRPLRVDYKRGIIKNNKDKRKYRKGKEEIEEMIRNTRRIIRRYPWIKRLYGYSFSENIKKKESFMYTPGELKRLANEGNKYVKWVEQGDIIGYIGVSGLIHGRLKYFENRKRPNLRKIKSWDKPHLHFEEATRDWESGEKILSRDPYGIYLSKEHYPNFNYDTLFIDFEKKISL